MKAYLLAAVAALTVSSVAQASDLSTKTVPSPAPAPVSKLFDWTGAYIGVNGGYGKGYSDITNVQFGTGTLYSYPDEDGNFAMNGSLVGGQLGYNQEIGRIVVGVEADLDYANMKGNYAFPAPNQINLAGKIDSFGTLRARFGYAFDNVLIFTTGGFAYASTKAMLASVTPPVITSSASKSYTGYTFGGGIEYGVSRNWTVKGEYLYSNFGKRSNKYDFTDDIAEAVADTSLKSNIMRVGLNYKF